MNDLRFHQLFDASQHPIWLADPYTLQFLALNPATVRKFGYPPAEYPAMSLTDLLAPTELGRLNLSPAGLAGVDKVGALIGIFHVRLQSGVAIKVEFFTCPVNYESREALLLLAIDITYREELRQTARDVLEHERRWVANELHDAFGQELTGLLFLLGGLKSTLTNSDGEAAAAVERAEKVAQRALDTCRRMSRTLKPSAAPSRALADMLRDLVDPYDSPSGPSIKVLTPSLTDMTLSAETSTHLFRIAQEAFANALRHSSANNIAITLEVRPSRIRLEILDDGRGLGDDVMVMPGIGLKTMQFRAGLIGARLSVTRQQPSGTRVICELPLYDERARISYESDP
jgi:signal transduction histidine kinase